MGQELVVFANIQVLPAIFGDSQQVDDILARIQREARAQHIDISTVEGRAACASLAYKISRSKTALDDMGKDLVAGLKAQTSAVDAERRRVREKLDALRDEIRRPLTAWEEKEKDRVATHEEALLSITEMGRVMAGTTLLQIAAKKKALSLLASRDWQEFSERAGEAIAAALNTLDATEVAETKRIADEAELVRLRQQEAQRQQEEAERKQEDEKRQIAAIAAENAKRQAEEKARAQQEMRDAAARAAQEALARGAAEAQSRAAAEAESRADAERRATEAEAERVAAAEQAEAARIAAAAEAEAQSKAAAENARAQERQRQAAEQQRQQDEARQREANRQHRSKINNEIVAALQAQTALGISESQAKGIVTAIAKGVVPHTKISY